MKIRPATPADAEAVATLVNRAYRPQGATPAWTHEAHLVAGDRIDAAGVRALLVPGSAVLLHCEGEALLGCVHVESRGAAAYIGMLTIEPAHQARGLGSQLLAQAEAWAHRHLGARELRMSVLGPRTDLLAYYARRGYQPTGESAAFPSTCGVGEARVPGLAVQVLAKRWRPRWLRLLQSRWAWPPLGLASVLLPVLGWQLLIVRLHLPKPLVTPVAGIGAALLALLGYRYYVRHIEQRAPDELSAHGMGRELGAGLALGALLFTLAIGLLALVGAFHVTGHGSPGVMVRPLVIAVSAGVTEELLFRGLVFRLCERAFGTWIALAFSAALFGLLHLANPVHSLAGAVAIIFEAGIMLAAAYLYTRRLWLPIGIHAAWNFTQGGLFGIPVSGNPMEGWIHGRLQGPDWLTGGSFGAEGSLVAFGVCVVAGLWLLRAAHAQGRFLARRAPQARATRAPAAA